LSLAPSSRWVSASYKAGRFFATGNTGVAVRASGAMPGILSPVGIAGVEYEDGDEAYPAAQRQRDLLPARPSPCLSTATGARWKC